MALVKHTNNSLSNITALPSAIPTGKMTLLSTATASSSASLSFDSTYINSDYQIYKFEFINMHTSNDSGRFQFQGNAVGGSGFDETMISTYFKAQHNQAGSYSTLAYATAYDNVGTGFTNFNEGGNTGSSRSNSSYLHLFNPSSTTFVKHFIGVTSNAQSDDYCTTSYIAGYFNTTSAIDEIQFKMSAGNIDSGQIKLYGLGS